jgi:hypothetical protein
MAMIFESPSPISADERDSLVTLLLACDDSKEFWDKTISELPTNIKSHFKEDQVSIRRISNLVARCLNVTHGLELLLNRVRENTARSIKWYELARAAFRMMTPFPDDSGQLADQLVNLIEEIAPNTELLNRANRLISGSPGPTPVNGYQAILRLFQLPDLRPALQFLCALAEELGDATQQAELRKWAEDAAPLFSIAHDQISPAQASATTSRNHLLIQLQPVSGSSEPFKLYSWLHDGHHTELLRGGDDSVYRLEEVADEIAAQASAILNTVSGDLEIELIVKRGVFSHDVTGWEITVGELKRSLIREVPLVLRCLERVEARRTDLAHKSAGLSAAQLALAAIREKQDGKNLVNLARWGEKCATLKEREDQEFESMIDSVVEAGQDLDHLMDELSLRDRGLCVWLGFVPPAEVTAPDEFSAVISSGVPIVVWFRQIPAHVKIDASRVKQICCQSKVKLAGLRRHLWELRKDAVRNGNGNDLCHHITLLYDDYDRIPPPPPNQTPRQNPAAVN